MIKPSDFLSHIYLFQALPPNEVAQIASFCSLREKKKGEILFSEGQEATAFYIVVHGRIKIYKLFAQGDEQIIHLHGDSDVVAEAAIFSRIRYPGNAQVLKDSLLLEIPKDPFINMILQNPQLALNMLSSYSKRLRQLITTIEYLSLKESKHKVALYLLKNSSSQKGMIICPLNHSKKEISGVIGITPESFSRSLALLKKENFIQEKEKGFVLTNKSALLHLLEEA